MLNQKIKQNPLWEKNQNFYIIYKAQRLYWWALMLVCLCICVIWYWCIPVVCADMVPEESQCNFCCKCACSVSAAPFDSRIYVMCGLCSVMFQSLFVFIQFFQFIQFHSCRDFRGLRCNPATSTMTQPSSPSLTSGQEGRSSCPAG